MASLNEPKTASSPSSVYTEPETAEPLFMCQVSTCTWELCYRENVKL